MQNYLSEEKVFVKYIMDTKNGIDDKTHPLYGGLSTNAAIGIPAPILTKRLNHIFTKDELEFLGKELGEDISIGSDFWKEFRADKNGMSTSEFPIYLKKEGALFNKNNALDYIKIKILQDCDIVANSLDESKQRRGCRFYLVSEKDMFKKEKASISLKQEAVKYYGKIEDDEEVLKYVLKSFNKSVDFKHKIEFLQNEVWKIMETNPTAFLATVKDENLKTKIQITDFLNYKLITKMNNLFYDLDGKKLALDGEVNDFTGAARYLDSGVGQEFGLELLAKVEALKKK